MTSLGVFNWPIMSVSTVYAKPAILLINSNQ